MIARSRRAGKGDEGQAAVELALVLPLVALLLLAVVQVVLVVRDQVLVVHAAREAARAAAVDPSAGVARKAALAGAPLAGDRLSLELSGREKDSGQVAVVLAYRSPTRAPVVGALLPDIVLHAQASMRREKA
ncbi:MAG TPA: TadE/TadG family type IV pilus assembly protein [Acidimicrobiales bacterium]|nr:TadE/TadG family type IV pilus assembly protein [Acidimicrobiales bacterium]